MNLVQVLAIPISLIYGGITTLRNFGYDWGVFASKEFNIPIISVGNLSWGGTGKTPHIEYLIRLLSPHYTIATLSRGYGRKTSGFMLAEKSSTSRDIGDEPRQYKRKFNDLSVAVDANRVKGVKKLLAFNPEINTILLDDAFQHRAIKPGLSILLTDYSKLYYNDYLIPSGTLRESKTGFKRADIIIVTKTPYPLSPVERRIILKDIVPQAYQTVFFSHIIYGDFISLSNLNQSNHPKKEFFFENNYSIVLLTAIAEPSSLIEYLRSKVKTLIPIRFPDHHEFSNSDLTKVKETFDQLEATKKIILTTEKDAMRLEKTGLEEIIHNLPFFYIPIEIKFNAKDEIDFSNQVLEYVKEK